MDVKTVQGPGGEQYVHVPDGMFLCLIPIAVAGAHSGWRECAAVRIASNEDGTAGPIEITDDMDWLTSPEASGA
jgi:hypothetical protein